jgi:hypothetical protein
VRKLKEPSVIILISPSEIWLLVAPLHKKSLSRFPGVRAVLLFTERASASKLIFLFLLGEEPTRRIYSREKSSLRLPIINIISAAGVLSAQILINFPLLHLCASKRERILSALCCFFLSRRRFVSRAEIYRREAAATIWAKAHRARHFSPLFICLPFN